MFKEETVACTVNGETRTFTVNNRKRTPKGDLFMDDAEFTAHKNEQKASMEKSMAAAQSEISKKAEKETLLDKAAQKLGMTKEELKKAFQ